MDYLKVSSDIAVEMSNGKLMSINGHFLLNKVELFEALNDLDDMNSLDLYSAIELAAIKSPKTENWSVLTQNEYETHCRNVKFKANNAREKRFRRAKCHAE